MRFVTIAHAGGSRTGLVSGEEVLLFPEGTSTSPA